MCALALLAASSNSYSNSYVVIDQMIYYQTAHVAAKGHIAAMDTLETWYNHNTPSKKSVTDFLPTYMLHRSVQFVSRNTHSVIHDTVFILQASNFTTSPWGTICGTTMAAMLGPGAHPWKTLGRRGAI